MEFLELFTLLDTCGCCFELLTLFADAGTGTAGWNLHRKKQNAKLTGAAPPSDLFTYAFWIMFAVSVILTVILVCRWVLLLQKRN